MKPIRLSTTAWPYIGQMLTEVWKDKGVIKTKKGYMIIAIKPSTDYTGVTILLMNPRGELRKTSFYFLCKYYTWEDKDKDFSCYEAI